VEHKSVFEFHISRQARDHYKFDDVLFTLTGNVVFANVAACRDFCQRMNVVREAATHPERAVHPGVLNAMALIDEALHAVMEQYRRQVDPRVMLEALEWFGGRLGPEALERALLTFSETFPVVAVYRGQQPALEWLTGSTHGVTHRAIALEEMLMLWLANLNPAFKPFKELFDDGELARGTAYVQLTKLWNDYFATRPRFGPGRQNLVDMLRAPALASPDSLDGQLLFISSQWTVIIGDLVSRMLTALDVLKEEQTAVWMRFHPPAQHFGDAQTWGDSSVAAVPQFRQQEHEEERFSADFEWMPRTVMMAKSVYVWLDQLSKEYKRPIRTLNQVPDEELDVMARRGFNGLWLIGLWERSRASQKIKQLCGNPEAAASAYSLADYSIAEDLGGESAYGDLRNRAWTRGIRLASDMVPNHMGIDSRWVIEHPDWFLSLPHAPYPAYSFNGPDVSPDNRVEIKIEDHYFDKTDAAVVFRRVDRSSGETRYIYHGNDGTSYPWNDTAQLNYLKAEVREAVIQTILHVARKFPIIRFDAAMTLAKRHYQRLWFPEPGTGGAIPSRAEHGLTKAHFDSAMPLEFWREVVDRVAAEAPSTLLLAEAFWLMEGYFVRTLGMHRVYNSAFMNMMRDEENANYRSVIKNTLTFDPDVLKRYVNFMNNPDERTAVDQFGKGDKYFGVCTLMATLPGLPMFGHGQIEGYTERYGMEYRRAYLDEQPDNWLVARHEREISPLLRRRYQFAEVDNFLLYDVFTDQGTVNEDVFAYSNRFGEDRALVVFNNRYAEAQGWVRLSCAYMEKRPDGSKHEKQKTLGESFGFSDDRAMFAACRDAITGLEHLHRARDLAGRGLKLHLPAYRCHVLLDWRDLREDATHPWGRLCDSLAGNGVPSLDDALRNMQLQPAHSALRALLDVKIVEQLARAARQAEKVSEVATTASAKDARPETKAEPKVEAQQKKAPGGLQAEPKVNPTELALAAIRQHADLLFTEVRNYIASGSGEVAGIRAKGTAGGDPKAAHELMQSRVQAALRLRKMLESPAGAPGELAADTAPVNESELAQWSTALAWCALEATGSFIGPGAPEPITAQLFEAMRLREPLAEAFAKCGLQGEEQWRAAARLRASFAHAGGLNAGMGWIHDPEVAWLIGVHEYDGVSYLVKEHFENFLWWMVFRDLLEVAGKPSSDRQRIAAVSKAVSDRMDAVEKGGYRAEGLEELAIAAGPAKPQTDLKR
jgi:glycosidase